jgi:hypothetical protein
MGPCGVQQHSVAVIVVDLGLEMRFKYAKTLLILTVLLPRPLHLPQSAICNNITWWWWISPTTTKYMPNIFGQFYAFLNFLKCIRQPLAPTPQVWIVNCHRSTQYIVHCVGDTIHASEVQIQ